MKIETRDPTVWIIQQELEYVVYETIYGESWEIHGTCNRCGECEVGGIDDQIVWTGIPIGQPGACYNKFGDQRLDTPVRPEIQNNPGCALTGNYIKKL